MRKRAIPLLLFSGGALLVLGGLCLWMAFSWPPGPAQRLPDGTNVTYLGITFGLPQKFLYGRPLQKWLHAGLPPPLQERLGVTELRFNPGLQNQLLVWLHAGSGGPPEFPGRAVLVDEHGCEMRGSRNFPFEPASGGGWLWRQSFTAYPRRGRSLRLRIYPRGSGDAVEFPLPRITGGPHPQWTPQPLPVSRRDGDLAVTLSDLRTGLGVDPSRFYGETRLSRAVFRVTRNGRPAPGWFPRRITISDATGNRWTPYGRGAPGPRGDLLWNLYTNLWPDEHAWKLRAEFVREHSFDPDELWTIRGVRVPRAGEMTGAGATFAKDGGLLRFLGLSGRAVSVRIEKKVPGLRVTLLRATDEHGRPVRRRMAFSEGSPYVAGLAPFKARSLNLTFGVYRTRTVEFLAAPVRPEGRLQRRQSGERREQDG